jgi:tRNA pseudouridine13 synthase
MLDSRLDLSVPYITNLLPGIGGQLRLTPDHFVVEEIPLYEPVDEGQHLYVRLTKVDRTTKDVQSMLARLFGIVPGDVGFAGLKDKRARTSQTFSLNVGPQRPGFAEEAAARIGAELPLEVHWARFHRNKLKRGHLVGNRFIITVTNLECPVDEALRRAAPIATALAQRGVPNYFGPQRFGVAGDNAEQGLALLLGQRRVQDRWLRQFLVAAFQSYLCNRVLARRVEQGAFDHLLVGDVVKKRQTGGMFVVSDLATDQARYAEREIDFTAPLFGPKMWAAEADAGALEAAVLSETPVGDAQFARLRIEGARRVGRLLLEDLDVRAGSEPDSLTFGFALTKGAFATTVLREFMKVDLAGTPALDDDSQDGDG